MRVVVADDSVLLREGIVRLLEDAGFDVVAQAGDAEDLVRKVGAHKPDVAIVDVRMPPTTPTTACARRSRSAPSTPGIGVLVLSQYVEPDYAQALLADDAGGRRLPAEGPRRRRRALHRRGPPGGRRGLRARPRGRLAAWSAASAATTRSAS